MKRESGLTLPEVAITLGLVGILCAVALGPIMDMVRGAQVKDAAQQLYGAITFARAEALKRNTCVDVAPVSTSNWSAGWTVQVPRDSTGTAVCGGTGTPLVVRRYTVQGSVSLSGPTASVRLNGTGRLTTLGDTSSSSLCNNTCSSTCTVNAAPPSFRVQLSNSTVLRCVSVRSSGAPEVKKG